MPPNVITDMPVIIYNIRHTHTNLLCFFFIYILCFIQFLSAARVVDFIFYNLTLFFGRMASNAYHCRLTPSRKGSVSFL